MSALSLLSLVSIKPRPRRAYWTPARPHAHISTYLRVWRSLRAPSGRDTTTPWHPIAHLSLGTRRRRRWSPKLVVVVVLLLLLAEALVLYLRGLRPLSRRVVAPMPLCDGGQLRCVPTAVARPALRGWVERAPPRRRQRHGGLLVRQPPAASTRIEVASVLLAHLVRVKVKAKMSVRRQEGWGLESEGRGECEDSGAPAHQSGPARTASLRQTRRPSLRKGAPRMTRLVSGGGGGGGEGGEVGLGAHAQGSGPHLRG